MEHIELQMGLDWAPARVLGRYDEGSGLRVTVEDRSLNTYTVPIEQIRVPNEFRIFAPAPQHMARCSIRSMLPSHYRDDGTCLCEEPQ